MSTRQKHRRLDKVEEARSAYKSEHTFASSLSDRELARIAWPDGPSDGGSWDELGPDALDTEIDRALNRS